MKPASFHVAFPVVDAPTGGGNQFLRALRAELVRRGRHTDDRRAAGVVLFNSYQNFLPVLALRRRNPDAIFIHRVDGPMRLYNRPDDPRDELAMRANGLVADATVFQTEWSRRANRELGWPTDRPEAVIGNAADHGMFRPRDGRGPGVPLRIIASSWSSNPNKGFDAYAWLDSNLDPAKFAMTFVGNTPSPFTYVRATGPLDSAALARELAAHDVFLTASRKDPCSNSVIEALTVGLPVVARADGGHPELVGEGGLLFENHADVPALLAEVAARYDAFRSAIRVPTIAEIADRYETFAREMADLRRAGRLAPRIPGTLAALRVQFQFRGR
ncbi:MAG: glycosyltransferase [Alphaproteobacteria bacterium]|nr:glycosyltransferase [Alphaproteobacteria bacterium]